MRPNQVMAADGRAISLSDLTRSLQRTGGRSLPMSESLLTAAELQAVRFLKNKLENYTSMTTSPSLRYGFASSRDLHAKLDRERQILRKAIEAQSDFAIADAIFNFCVTGYSLKDWIKHENNLLRNTVEDLINNTPVLAACADICNSSKHKVLTQGIRAHSTGRLQNSELTADMTTISASSTIPINGYTVRIMFDDGSQIEILHFSNQVYDTWEKFLNTNGL